MKKKKKRRRNGSKVPLLLFSLSCEVLHPRVKLCHPPFPGSQHPHSSTSSYRGELTPPPTLLYSHIESENGGWSVLCFFFFFIPSVAAPARWIVAWEFDVFPQSLKMGLSTSRRTTCISFFVLLFFFYPDDYDRIHPSKVRAKILLVFIKKFFFFIIISDMLIAHTRSTL